MESVMKRVETGMIWSSVYNLFSSNLGLDTKSIGPERLGQLEEGGGPRQVMVSQKHLGDSFDHSLVSVKGFKTVWRRQKQTWWECCSIFKKTLPRC